MEYILKIFFKIMSKNLYIIKFLCKIKYWTRPIGHKRNKGKIWNILLKLKMKQNIK
jgi:hypothetical protein